ncbi:MAG: patatin-like phospholipase family protein [Clostridia bacterium]|jgi:NTE family protein
MKQKPKVGIALGGGAGRGIAHIGVLQVLTEKKIPIDMVAGTSIGAIIGALYCCGVGCRMMEKIALHLDEKAYFDVTVPRKGFMKGDRIQSLVQTLTGNKNFEDLAIPLGVVAVDLNQSKAIIFRRGKIHKAVRASISIPGLFEPVETEGMVLVDGGIIDRVPVSALQEMGADITIGVDVGFRGTHQKANGILEIILQSFEVMEWEMVKHRTMDADVMITPDLMDINPTTLAQASESIELGRKAAETAVPEIRRLLLEWMERNGTTLMEARA